MTVGDEAIERAATRLQRVADRLAGEGGLKAKLAEPLADDAQFLRRLKPSLIAARARGTLPTDEAPTEPLLAPAVSEPGQRPKRADGPNPFVVIAAALAVGVILAKVVDWRSHAHPRD